MIKILFLLLKTMFTNTAVTSAMTYF